LSYAIFGHGKIWHKGQLADTDSPGQMAIRLFVHMCGEFYLLCAVKYFIGQLFDVPAFLHVCMKSAKDSDQYAEIRSHLPLDVHWPSSD